MRISMGQWFLAIFTICISWNAMAATAVTDYDKELLYRLRFSNPQDIQLLLDHGANPNAESEQGVPALTLVMSRTDDQALPLMKALIAKGANVNNGGKAGQPPLVQAAGAGNMQFVRFLVEEAKANLNILDGKNYSPVQIAKANGRQEVEKYLMQAIANLRPEKPNTPEYMALQERLLGYHSCARQYLSFYYASKQDAIPEATQKAKLQEQTDAMRAAMSDLYQIFKIPQEMMVNLQQQASSAIAAELNALISNRYRREKGVGKDEDMKKRCDAIAAKYKFDRGVLSNLPRNR